MGGWGFRSLGPYERGGVLRVSIPLCFKNPPHWRKRSRNELFRSCFACASSDADHWPLVCGSVVSGETCQRINKIRNQDMGPVNGALDERANCAICHRVRGEFVPVDPRSPDRKKEITRLDLAVVGRESRNNGIRRKSMRFAADDLGKLVDSNSHVYGENRGSASRSLKPMKGRLKSRERLCGVRRPGAAFNGAA